MAMLLLDRSQLEVRSEGDTLVLYEAGERRGTVPVKLVDRCVIHGAQTRLDSGVLLKLAEAGVSTVLFSPRMGRRVATVLGPAHNDAAVRLAQALRVQDPVWCLAWARQAVGAKLLWQRKVLGQWLAARPDARKPLLSAAQALDEALASVPQADALDSLRGLEGHAARMHFAGLAAVVPPALQFEGRNRRPPRDPVNVCLSLAYSLLHVDAVQGCHAAGLDPLLGFYHRPAIGRESLASDLIEPLRAQVDHWVWDQLRLRNLRAEHFSHEHGACMLGKAGRAAFYGGWHGQAKPLRRWLRRVCMRLAGDLRQQGSQWLDPFAADLDEADE